MEKLDKVIAGIRNCWIDHNNCYEKCPYYVENPTKNCAGSCVSNLIKDVFDLLNIYKKNVEQITQTPGIATIHYEERIDRLTGEYSERPCCECGRLLDYTDIYCGKCKKKIKWN